MATPCASRLEQELYGTSELGYGGRHIGSEQCIVVRPPTPEQCIMGEFLISTFVLGVRGRGKPNKEIGVQKYQDAVAPPFGGRSQEELKYFSCLALFW